MSSSSIDLPHRCGRPVAVVRPYNDQSPDHPDPPTTDDAVTMIVKPSVLVMSTSSAAIDNVDEEETVRLERSTSTSSCRRHDSASSDDDDDVIAAGSQLHPAGRQQLQPRATAIVRPTVIDGDDVSALPFYHGRLSSTDAKRLLAAAPVGTFLLRDSLARHLGFPLAISVVVAGATSSDGGSHHVTSVRVARCQRTGNYRLDCDADQRQRMREFRSVTCLVDYLRMTSSVTSVGSDVDVTRKMDAGCVLIDRSGGGASQPLRLIEPLLSSATTR